MRGRGLVAWRRHADFWALELVVALLRPPYRHNPSDGRADVV
jgi:hypothetical protein